MLSLSPVGEQTDELDEWFLDDDDEFSLSPVGEQGQFVPQGEQASLSPIGGHANSGEYPEDYEQDNSVLHTGGEPAFAEPPPQEMNGKAHNHTTGYEKNHHLDIDRIVDLEELLLADPEEKDERLARLLKRCRERMEGIKNRETFTVGYVAEQLREEIGGSEPIHLYEEVVERCLATG
jgi:hypothetical protein